MSWVVTLTEGRWRADREGGGGASRPEVKQAERRCGCGDGQFRALNDGARPGSREAGKPGSWELQATVDLSVGTGLA